MASSVYDTGYEDELFQYPVGPSLHCCICTNVIKDPVMRHNEHIFCRACITTHLMYSHTCPTCMQPLTVETLRQTTWGIRNLLSELQIRCEFFDRGCGKFVQLGDLERHVADCGFAPAVCSNEGCQLEVIKQDLREASSVVYNDEILVTGGEDKLMEKLSLNAVQVDQSTPWENVLAELPGWLIGHRILVHNGRLVAIGGYERDKDEYSDSITEISLVPPYLSKLLATMPQGRYLHGAVIFDDKILIVGGRESGRSRSIL